MSEAEHGSVTHWLGDLKVGDLAAAQPLWERYFGKLVVLARSKLRSLHKTGAEGDEEDAALSAFNSFCTGAAGGKFPKLDDREDLWKLLVVITARKAFAQVGRERRLKRGGGRRSTEADRDPKGLDLLAGPEPSPEFAAMVAEEFRRLLDSLEDDGLREVALRRMEGYTCDEIAEHLGCARRTVARRLDLIRKTWSHGSGEDPC
ncbi:ECF-type sigma factor [Paludisphaera mucosa]|uniref:ECF-type sigma factor n=1 Tax=Paludisphaera mucosa TaxID=3030827 RepID=A0ABT6FGM9_9BACT|nr:ECF-type sigma factor [Paludisphaera mucosa]MDG3006664.1 ECF-type sigma factor [Paludisphaera mucosa]